MREFSRHGLRVIFVLGIAFGLSLAAAQSPVRRGAEPDHPCGRIYTDHYGPHDYRTERDKLEVVEKRHFTPRIEALIGGESGSLGQDLNYTLLASPNHHRALVAVLRYAERLKSLNAPGMPYSLDCYFDRAIRYRPDDAIVRALFAKLLAKFGRVEDAVVQLDAAARLSADNPIGQYNIGLVFLEIGMPDRALAQAHRALEMGVTRTELSDALRRINKWEEPPSAPQEGK